MAKVITEEAFRDVIKQGVTLVDFFADWCGPCRMLAPVLEKVAEEVKGKATIAKVDIDQALGIATELEITSVPTVILFKDGKEVGRIVGLRDVKEIVNFILSV